MSSSLSKRTQSCLKNFGYKFHDVILKTKDKKSYSASKAVLSLYSDFFYCLFRNDEDEIFTSEDLSSNIFPEFQLPSVRSPELELILKYIEGEDLTLTEKNVQKVLEAADYLSIDYVRSTCIQYLLAHLSAENCIGFEQYGRHLYLPELFLPARQFILENFREVARHDEINLISEENLINILSSDDLQCNEETVWRVILRWCEWRQTRPSIELLNTVRYGLMDILVFKRKVALHPFIKDTQIPNAVDRFHEVCANLSEIREQVSTPALAVSRSHPVLPLCVGGWSQGSPVSSILAYSVGNNLWSELEVRLPDDWAYMGTVYSEGNLYLCGGRSTGDNAWACRQLWRLNLSTMEFKRMSKMQERRNYVSITHLGNSIYALGGNNLESRLNSCERYDISLNQWFPITSMKRMRSDAAAVALLGKIYVIGGFDGFEPTNTVEEYNPATGKWNLIRPMAERRSGVKAVVVAGKIYVVGGWDGRKRLRSGEAYNPQSKQWEPMATMRTPRSNHGLFGLETRKQILVVGGYEGHSTTELAELYDVDMQQWTTVEHLPAKRSAMSSCIIPADALTNEVRNSLQKRDSWLEEKRRVIRNERESIIRRGVMQDLLNVPVVNQIGVDLVHPVLDSDDENMEDDLEFFN